MFTHPKDKTILSFSGSPTVALARLLLESTPGVQCSETLLRSSPTLQTLQTLPHHPPPPPTIRLCLLRSAGLVKRVWPAPDQWLRDQMAACWAGFTSPVAMSCMCFCVAEVFFMFSNSISPGSIVWGLFFSPHFPHVNAVFFFNSTRISLLIILVWLCMWRIIKNLEPWTLNGHCHLSSKMSLKEVKHWWVSFWLVRLGVEGFKMTLCQGLLTYLHTQTHMPWMSSCFPSHWGREDTDLAD